MFRFNTPYEKKLKKEIKEKKKSLLKERKARVYYFIEDERNKLRILQKITCFIIFILTFIIGMFFIDYKESKVTAAKLNNIVNSFPEIEFEANERSKNSENDSYNDFVITDEEIEENVIYDGITLSPADKEYLHNNIKSVPVNVWNLMLEKNVEIIVTADMSKYGKGDNVNGTTFRTEYIYKDGSKFYTYRIIVRKSSLNSILHEVAHFYMFYLEAETDYMKSEEYFKLKNCYQKERTYIDTFENEEYYVLTDEDEFFAESFSYFCGRKWEYKEDLEETRQFWITLLQQV